MRKLQLILALLGALTLWAGPAMAQADNLGQVQTFTNWQQLGRATDIAVTTVTQSEALGTLAPVAVVYNTGTNWGYVNLSIGAGTVTAANGTPVPPGGCISMHATKQTYISAITATGTTTLQVALGIGSPGSCGSSALGSSQPTKPGTFTALGYCQLTSLSAATLLSSCAGGIPAGATVAQISVETAAVRYRDDGVAPTTTVGMPAPIGSFQYSGPLSALQFIAQTAGSVVDVSFYK